MRARALRLFLDADRYATRIEFDDAIGLGIAHLIAENGGTPPRRRRPLKRRREAIAIKDIVAQHQRHTVVANEVAPDQESLRQPLGPRLLGVTQRHAPLPAIPEQPLEPATLRRRRDDQDVANVRQHQCRQRVIDHRLIVDRQQLLAYRQGNWIEACAGTAGEYDSLHSCGSEVPMKSTAPAPVCGSTARRCPPVPRRSPRYRRDQIGSHHHWLSRYHDTVLRSPVSNVSRGSQHSSLRIFAVSMA